MEVLAAQSVTSTVHLSRTEQRNIVHEVSLSIAEGESIAIMGRSGSGKTSLLSLLGLLSRPSSGAVLLGGEDTTSYSDASLARARNMNIGFVLQSYSLVKHLTAQQNVELPLLYGDRVKRKIRKQRSRELLEMLELGDRLKLKPKALSGGEQQRVAIARALVRQPKVILADEPTGALDVKTADLVLSELLRVCRELGTALVIVTHDHEVAQKLDRVIELAEGAIVQTEAGNRGQLR